jgi:hypothetical protein
MNPDLHPQPLNVFRHARGSLVSSGQDTLNGSLYSFYIRPRRTNMRLLPAIQSPDNGPLILCLIPLHPFMPIQST